jgi:DNA invertase Pin-like site-specific DNA recombinase
MRVAVYTRTYSDLPDDLTIEDQAIALQDFCDAQGWDVVSFYSDENRSGQDMARPGYIRMMAEMQIWDAVVAARASVVHTNSMNHAMMLRRLEREGKRFIPMAGPEDLAVEEIRQRAAVYIRVSTEEQAMEGYSLDAQRKILEDFCISENWSIVKIYADEGYSGRKTNRPAYQEMMSEMDQWDVLLVMKMDRIHRNSRNFMAMMETLQRNGKQFASFADKLDTSNALGRFTTDIMQRIAQLESEQTGERTYMGMREKAETLDRKTEGKRTMGFTPPFGYTLEDGKLKEVPEELSVVSEIFEMYSVGSPLDMIAYELNGSGTLTRKGNPWNKYNLRNILHNPVYAGYMRWEDVLIRHDARTAVSPEEYNRIQELMASKVRDPSKRAVYLVPTI